MYKMYGSQWDSESNNDKDSLNSSFWSDGERRQDEEEVQIERVVREEDSKPVGDAEDSDQEASEEEEIKGVIGQEESKAVGDSEDSYQETSEEEEVDIGEDESRPVGDSEDSYTEASEEEEEEIKRVIGEEESKPVGDSEDSYLEGSEKEKEIKRMISEEKNKSADDAEDYSCQEASEEEEEISEEESKPVGDSEDSYQEASEKEDKEIERAISEEESKPADDTEDSYQEASEEEHEENERAIGKEESQSVDDAEDSCQETSEEEEIGEEESKPVDNAEDSCQEASEEEDEEMERAICEEESKPFVDAENSYQEASEEEKPEPNNQVSISGERFEGGNNDDEESSDSPAPSLITSGYGTYRPEEMEGGDFRDDHTIREFDQDSRGDLSEMRDDEEDDFRSLRSFGGFDIEATEPDYNETRPLSVFADAKPEATVSSCRNKNMKITDTKPDEGKHQADEEKFEDLYDASDNEVTNAPEEQHQVAVDRFILYGKHLEDGNDVVVGGNQYEKLEEEVHDLKEENKEKEVDKVESEDPDESSSNKDIKFIDSKVDFSQMTYDKMCEEWEGNLRRKKDAASCLEERLADLHLSPSAQRDFEAENKDVTSQSDTQSSETEGVSFSAFESYMRGMTRTQSDGDLRPKPKSFIRPVMSQQTLKKTDPVAKYFQYKQLWDMFKLPGEKDRRDLRLEIKERLAYKPPPPKPRRVYVPNTYIVPTEKKRSALRWEIRNDLANGLLPHKFNYRF